MNNNQAKDNFQRMLDLAEFSAKRHNDRRSVEFKVFISYMTPLILTFYQVIKLDSRLVSSVNWSLIIVGTIGYILGIHLVYVLWQIGIAIAMKNDGWRRNFYLKKAECILHHLENPDGPFDPSNDTVTVDCGYEKTQKRNFWQLFKHLYRTLKGWFRMTEKEKPQMTEKEKPQMTEKEKIQMTEKELFMKPAANFIFVRNFWQLFKHFNQIWKDWSRMFVVGVPTGLLVLLIVTLVLKKINWLP